MTDFDKTTISNAAKSLESASESMRSFRETIKTMKYAKGGVVSGVDFGSGEDKTTFRYVDGAPAPDSQGSGFLGGSDFDRRLFGLMICAAIEKQNKEGKRL